MKKDGFHFSKIFSANEESKISLNNKKFYEAMIEFIDSETVFFKEVTSLIILCNYKLKVIDTMTHLQGKQESFKKNTAYEDLSELSVTLETLKSLVSPVENLAALSKQFKSQPVKDRNNAFYKQANETLISHFNIYYNCRTLGLKFDVFLSYLLYYEKYVKTVDLLFKNENPEILYLVDSKYIETIAVIRYSYQLGNYQLSQSDLYTKVLTPMLSSALISIMQRGPKYVIFFQNMFKYAPPEMVDELDSLIKTCELKLYSINRNKALHQGIAEPKKSVDEKKMQPLSILGRFFKLQVTVKQSENKTLLASKTPPGSERPKPSRLRASSSAPPGELHSSLFGKSRKQVKSYGLPTVEEKVSVPSSVKGHKCRLFRLKNSNSAPPRYQGTKGLSGSEIFSSKKQPGKP